MDFLCNDDKEKEYNDHQDKFINLINEYQYIFQVSKICGYSEWVSVFKKQTTATLYSNISCQFSGLVPQSLFIISPKNDNDKLIIPNDNDILISDFIKMNSEYFKPIYQIPLKIVYKIYYDDGCDHSICGYHSKN